MIIPLYMVIKTHFSILIYIREKNVTGTYWYELEQSDSAKGTRHSRSDVCAAEI